MNARPFLLITAITMLGASAAACRTGWSPAGEFERNRVGREELVSTNARMAYEALERVRPSWMTSRGPVSITDATEARPNVYMNGARLGDLDYLKEVYVSDVEELRYWTAGEAGARFGMGNPRGVIEIVPRR